jgi:WD40 repeat protein
MIDPEVKRNPVEELAEAFLERYRRGERPSLTEYIRQRPDLADEIRELFPALAMMEEAGPGDTPSGASGRIAAKGPLLERLGDYRILREVGRGGMGIVFEAEQEALGRRVALKVLPLAISADAARLQRFRREARSAARLHHTNIVPVFDVGEHQGVHYYAMQFIQGQGLDEVLLEVKRLRAGATVAPGLRTDAGAGGKPPSNLTVLAGGLLTGQFRVEEPAEGQACEPEEPTEGQVCKPAQLATAPTEPHAVVPAPKLTASAPASGVLSSQSEFSAESDFRYYRSVAKVGLQVAEALAYAQGQKVLHRDIKPSNLLLDMQGMVWVTDFGLAKEEGSDLTRTGDVVGTLRYMAPERFNGISDGRSDIYSLGLTLYELLALKPAIEESHRDQFLRRINTEDLPRLRRWDRRVPRDLETIVLKASAKEAGRRYLTAEAMADDLRRFLADRPILARRASAREQLWRWCRRNPALATLTGAVVVLLAVIAAVSAFSALRLRDEEKATREQLLRTEQAEEKGRQRLFEALLAQARASRMTRQPGQRFAGLRAIQEAMKLPLPPGHSLDELRTEAIACLMLPDFEVEQEWKDGWPVGSSGLAFDAPFERYARGDKDGNVSIRRVADDKQLLTLPGAGLVDNYGGHEFSPDGRILYQRHQATKSFRSRLWKLDDPRPVCMLDGEYFGFAFSPSGRECAAFYATDGSLGVYDTSTGTERRRWPVNFIKGGDVRLSWNPKRPLLTAHSREGVWVVNVETGQVEWTVPSGSSWAPVAWHPEGRLLAVGDIHDLKIRLWDIETRQLVLSPLEGHKNGGIVLRFDASGERLLSSDWSGTWRLWDVQTGRQLLSLAAGGTCLQFNAAGTLASADATSPRIRMFRYRSGREFRTLIPRRGPHMDAAGVYRWAATLDRDGRLLAVQAKGGVALLDMARGEEIGLLSLLDDAPLAFEPSGALLTNGYSGVVRWPVAIDPVTDHRRYGPPERLFDRTNTDGHGASADRRVLAIPSYNHGAIVLHRDDNHTVRLRPQQDVRTSAVSPDGSWAATGSHTLREGAGAKVWDARTGKLAADLPVAGMCPVAFSPDGKWLATGGGGVRLWEVGTWGPGRS